MSRTDDPGLPEGADNSPTFLLHKEGYTIQDYRLIARIGEGSFGEVWKAERGGFFVALKILKTSMTSDETQRELKSLETLRKLHHRYLLHTENFWSDGDRLFIEMELAEGGTLKERLKAHQAAGKAGIPEDEVLKYFTEMAKALDYLHGHRPVFLHRDIKPANILLVQGCAKLADFGLLRQVAGDNSSTKTQGGTFPYMAPESIASDVFSIYTDLFAFAVTYAELRQGDLPFSGKNQYQICDKILREPPALSDIFHPDEKKVVLKALAKDPRQRFTSCGEFVFELNRAVPWVPAVEVPVLAPPGLAERAAPAKGTDPKQPHLADLGTARKQAPVNTTDSQVDGTAIHDSTQRPGQAATPPAKKQPAPDTARPGTEPKPAFAPPRPKLPPRVLVGIALAVAGVAALTGVWFLANRGAHDEVRDLIAKNKFAEATQAIRDANRLFLPSGDALQKEVAEKWWNELKEPGQDDSPETLKRSLRELDKFKDSFSNHDGVKPRRAKFQSILFDAVAKDVDRSLIAKKIDAARDMVTQYEEFLLDRGKSLQVRIDAKQEVLTVLKRAAEKLRKNEFEGCLDLLKASRGPFEHKDDLDEKNLLLESAKSGASARDEAHKKRLAVVEDLFKAKKTKELQTELAALIQFRKEYPRADWQPDLRKFQPGLVMNDLLAAAWAPLLADIVVIEDCRRGLKEFKDHLGQATDKAGIDPLYEKNLRALEALVSAHEASKDGWSKAIEVLAALLRENNQPGDLNRNLWSGLAQLEKNRALFRFEDLEALPNVPADEPAKKASSVLFAQALERLVKKDNYQWLPGNAEMAKCALWCDQRIIDRSASILAFEAECLVESGAALEKINQITFPLKTDWYASYVHALVKDQNQKRAEAADILAGVLKENAKALNPRGRSKNAARILRSAVADLKRAGKDGKEFAEPRDAVKAIAWLTPILTLEDATRDDLANLGRAHRAEVELANADVAKSLWDSAIARSARAQNFANRWRSSDLENAADLNEQAVAIEVRAAFGKTRTSEEKQRVFERALKKANEGPADGFFVPVVVAKLAFAWTEEYPVVHLKKTIEEGEAALKLAAAAEASSKSMKPWWATLRCQGMVKLADVHLRSLKERAKAKEIFDKEALVRELENARNLYVDARKMATFTERWKGELALKIGNVHLALGNSDLAGREFADSLQSLKTIPQPYPAEIRAEVDQARAFLEKAIETLKKPN
jgi:serine/threonine protein kinase